MNKRISNGDCCIEIVTGAEAVKDADDLVLVVAGRVVHGRHPLLVAHVDLLLDVSGDGSQQYLHTPCITIPSTL